MLHISKSVQSDASDTNSNDTATLSISVDDPIIIMIFVSFIIFICLGGIFCGYMIRKKDFIKKLNALETAANEPRTNVNLPSGSGSGMTDHVPQPRLPLKNIASDSMPGSLSLHSKVTSEIIADIVDVAGSGLLTGMTTPRHLSMNERASMANLSLGMNMNENIEFVEVEMEGGLSMNNNINGTPLLDANVSCDDKIRSLRQMQCLNNSGKMDYAQSDGDIVTGRLPLPLAEEGDIVTRGSIASDASGFSADDGNISVPAIPLNLHKNEIQENDDAHSDDEQDGNAVGLATPMQSTTMGQPATPIGHAPMEPGNSLAV